MHIFVSNDKNLLVQFLTKHASDSDPAPTQSRPPSAGEGLLHKRVRVLTPLPHGSLQEDQLPQADHLPWTETAKKETVPIRLAEAISSKSLKWIVRGKIS